MVTGAGSGIGKAAALLLAQHGARVVMLDVDGQRAKEVCDEATENGGQAISIACDISSDSAVAEALGAIDRTYRRLDIVFANAGINGVWAPIEQIQAKEFDQTIAVNLRGTFLTIKHSVPMLRRQGGSVIVTSSINGTRTFSNVGASPYAASKAAQVALAKMLALELAPDKIRVNVICPGSVRTHIGESTEVRGRDELGRARPPHRDDPEQRFWPGTPEQVAQLVLFLASDASSLITGSEIWIDGAQSLLHG